MVLEKIEEQYKHMFPAEKKVADYIRENSDMVVDMNIADLAEGSNTSEATVIRICRRLGYKGFYQFKISLAKEGAQHPLIGYHGAQDDPETVNYILQETANNIVNLSNYLNMNSVVACATIMREASIIHIVATGNTIPVAQDFAFRLSRLGIRTNCSFVPEYSLGNINIGSSSDAVVAISHSGSSIPVLQAIELAHKKKMKVISITDVKQNSLAKYSTVTLVTPVRNNLYRGFGAASNVHTLVILDVLLYFVGNLERTTKEIDDLELILSEYKL